MITISNSFKIQEISQTGLSGFKCYGQTKIDTPIRIVNNKIECFSKNGRECTRGLNTDQKCRKFLSRNTANIQTIKIRDQKLSSKARFFFHTKWHCSSETGISTGIRLNEKSGNIECLSQNGRDCIWGTYGDKMCNKVKTCKQTQASIKPLQCGDIHKRFWGNTGYNSSQRHWCKIGFGFFYATGRWLCKRQTGIHKLIRLSNDGEAECASLDGRKCIEGVRTARQCKNIILSKAARLKTLKCGEEHFRIYRKSGYFTKGHWCQKGFNLFYKRRIDLLGYRRLKFSRHHIYRKVVKSADGSRFRILWRRLRNRIKHTDFFLNINRWSRRHRVNLKNFWKSLKKNGWKHASKTTPWWNKFRISSKRRNINVIRDIKVLVRIVRKYRVRLGRLRTRGRGNFRGFMFKRWSKFTKRLRKSRFSKYLRLFSEVNNNVGTKSFWRWIRRWGWNAAVRRCKWWNPFVRWLKRKNINFRRIRSNIKKIIRRWRSKMRRIWRRKNRRNGGNWNRRGRFLRQSGINKRRTFINIRRWRKVIGQLRRTRFWNIFGRWAKKNNLNQRKFWRKLRKTNWGRITRTGLWRRFIIYTRRRNINIRRDIRMITTILRRARPVNHRRRNIKRTRITRKKWMRVVNRLRETRLWRIYSNWTRRNNINTRKFWNKVRRYSWIRCTGRSNVWRRFIIYTRRRNINIRRDIRMITTILRRARPRYSWNHKGRFIIYRHTKNYRRSIKDTQRKRFRRATVPYHIWRRTVNKITRSQFWNILSTFTTTLGVNPNILLRKLNRRHWKRVIRNISWWRKFIRYTRSRNINIKKMIRNVKNLIKKVKKNNSWHHSKKRISTKIWKKYKNIIKNTRFVKLFNKWSRDKNLNQKRFWKKVRGTSFKKAIKKAVWWIEFTTWITTQEIDIYVIVSEITTIIEEIRENYGTSSGIHKYILKVPSHKWEKLKNNLKAGRFWQMLKTWKTTINLTELWKRFKKYGVNKALKKSPWWGKFKQFIGTNNMPIKRMYRDFRRRFKKSLKNILYGKRQISWRVARNDITRTKFWSVLQEFAEENSIKIDSFLRKIREQGFDEGIRKITWWRSFEVYLRQRGIVLRRFYLRIRTIIRRFRIRRTRIRTRIQFRRRD